MKTFYIITSVAILWSSQTSAQSNEPPSTNQNAVSPLDPSQLHYMLGIAIGMTETAWPTPNVPRIGSVMSPSAAAKVNDDWFQSHPQSLNADVALSHRSQIMEIFKGFDESSIKFASVLPSQSFIDIGGEDRGLVLIVYGAIQETTYNIQRTTQKTRASKAVEDVILPSLSAFAPIFDDPKIRLVGMSVAYGAKDLADPNAFITPESVLLIVGVESCKKFKDRTLTQEELVDGADIYISDNSKEQFRKVKLTLE